VSGAGQLAGAGAGRFYGLLVWLIGLGAIILLWQRQSSAYFQGQPRYWKRSTAGRAGAASYPDQQLDFRLFSPERCGTTGPRTGLTG
jgi:hypothetical protein